MQPHFAALVDTPTGALLMLTSERHLIAFLVNNTPDTTPSWGVNYPNYTAAPFPIPGIEPDTYPQYTWNGAKRLFEPTPAALLSDRVRHTSALAVKKSRALHEVIGAISTARNLLWCGVLMQESVHLTKKAQALAYQAAGFPEEDLLRYPYVLQYAEVEGLAMRDAALEIIFKAQLDDEVLARTEAVRMKYFALLKGGELDTIDGIMESFRGEVR